jgi:hypothetical protein
MELIFISLLICLRVTLFLFLWTVCLFYMRLLDFYTLTYNRSLHIIEISPLCVIWTICVFLLVISFYFAYDKICHVEICFIFVRIKFMNPYVLMCRVFVIFRKRFLQNCFYKILSWGWQNDSSGRAPT